MARAWTLLIALLLLSGCALPMREDATASESLEAAAQAAREWDATSRLLGVVGFESTAAAQAEDPEWLQQLRRADPGTIGDGRAPAWLFVFLGEAPEPLYVVVAAGQVVYAESVGADDARLNDVVRLGREPLGRWGIDSAAAASTLHADAQWVTALEEADEVRWTLAKGRGAVEAQWVAYFGQEAATIGSESGTLGRFVEETEKRQEGSAVLSLSVQEDHAARSLSLEDADQIRFLVRVDDPLPLDSITVDITAPSGQTQGVALSSGPTPTRLEATMDWFPVEPGAWLMEADLVRGFAAEVQIFWCTSDEESEEDERSDESDESDDNPAC